ncbi:MAG: ATP-binding protein [FCB group bacterium]|nr:ATP-binding protein [FCB group bacterium]
MAVYNLCYPSVVESEQLMQKDLEKILRENSIDDLTTHNFVLIISEAFTNAMVHGNCLNPAKEINVVININGNVLSADIEDQGQDGLEKIKGKLPPTLLSEGGRGIDIIKYYASLVEFTETESGGLKVYIKIPYNDKNKSVEIK